MRATYIEQNERPITAHEFIHEQANDLYCLQASSMIGLPGLANNLERKRYLVCSASLDGAVQNVFPTLQQPRIFYHLPYQTLSRHPGERHMYDSMPRQYCGLHVENDDYISPRDSRECTKKSRRQATTPLQIFPESGPLVFVAIDIMGALLKTLSANQFVLLM